MSYDATALQNFWLNQAGLTLNILPSRTFNSTTYQTMDTQTEVQTFLLTNADPNGPTNFTSPPITVWFSHGFGGDFGLSLIDANRSWIDADNSTTYLTAALAHELGHTFGPGHLDTPSNLMNPALPADVQLSDLVLNGSQVSTVLASNFVHDAPVGVPGPVVGAGLLGLVTGFAAMLAWYRKRRAVGA